MILLTINMNMFNLDIDDSFNSYLDEIKPGIIELIYKMYYGEVTILNLSTVGYIFLLLLENMKILSKNKAI